jgi:hypothetical protein
MYCCSCQLWAVWNRLEASPNSVFRVDGRVEGAVNNLYIPNFEVRGLANTHIKASARLRGLPDMNKAYFDVNIADFNTSAADVSPNLRLKAVSRQT